MGSTTDQNPTKFVDFVEAEHRNGETGMLKFRIVSSSESLANGAAV